MKTIIIRWFLVIALFISYLKPIFADNRNRSSLFIDADAARQSGLRVVVIVVGTRPEIIKMAPVIREFKERKKSFFTVVIGTGQHQEMIAQMLKTLKLKNEIDVSLAIMNNNISLAELTCSILNGVHRYLLKLRPHFVIVQGDTTTSFASALAAFYLKIPVCHVEAGLRTWNHLSPYPEEFNRQSISSMSTIHFAATAWAANNLLSEKRHPQSIYVTGNPVVDSLQTILSNNFSSPSTILVEILSLAKVRGGSTCRIVLLTVHRRENLFSPLGRIMQAVYQLLQAYTNIVIIYPLHKNPNVLLSIKETMPKQVFDIVMGGKVQSDEKFLYMNRILFVEPLDYPDLLHLMRECTVILTDSGGLQEEGVSMGKPIFILRTTTERPEGVSSRVATLVGTDTKNIFGNVSSALQGKGLFLTAKPSSVYGDGKAAIKIADIIQSQDPDEKQSVMVQDIEAEEEMPCNLVVLFTVWRKGENLNFQLDMLKRQSVLQRIGHTCVQIFQNGNHTDVSAVVKNWQEKAMWEPLNVHLTYIYSEVETGYYGRFVTPLTADTFRSAYFVIADDDIIWGSHYLENMIRVVDSGYLATRNGRYVTPQGEEVVVPFLQQLWRSNIKVTFEEDVDYDFGGHTWAGRIAWLKKAWRHPPVSYDNCEDFWISAVVKNYVGIGTRSPKCPEGRPEMCACSHQSAHNHIDVSVGSTKSISSSSHNDIQNLIIKQYDYEVLMKTEPAVVDRVSKLFKVHDGSYDTSNKTLEIFKNCLYWV